jgi:hypothetical protein
MVGVLHNINAVVWPGAKAQAFVLFALPFLSKQAARQTEYRALVRPCPSYTVQLTPTAVTGSSLPAKTKCIHVRQIKF